LAEEEKEKDDAGKTAPETGEAAPSAEPDAEARAGHNAPDEGAPPADQELPPNYFRAAGDPPEPEPEPEPEGLQAFIAKARGLARAGEAKALIYAREGWTQARGWSARALAKARTTRGPRSLREAAIWSGWAFAGFAALVFTAFLFVTWGMPSTDDLWEARQGQSITFRDRNNQVILREGAQNAPPVDIESLPDFVPQAFLAIEDRRFYEHMGVDFGGVMRAGLQNVRAGRVVQGGSTITQQLAKNLFLSNERTWRRKAQEVVLALGLEQRFTKDQILALYLSRVYFGAGAYGVEAAAERYFDRPARELTLLQAAMLAGLVKAPSRLNPANQDIDAARARAAVVLEEMVAEGFIQPAERDAALAQDLIVSRRNPAGILAYFRDFIDPILNREIGTQRDDFIVETTLDIEAQRAGAAAVAQVLDEKGAQFGVTQAALIGIDSDGAIRSMVGGRDYNQSQFNRATQARRQPGSAFKYFIYLAAMENGLTPWSIRDDAPSQPGEFGDWNPGNYEDKHHGLVTLDSAFTHSFNMVAIRVANEVGHRAVIDVAQRLGVQSPLQDYRSLALGAQEVTLIEMTRAYAAMANSGYMVEPHGISAIRRANDDEVMWSFRPTRRQRVIFERPMRYMNLMMSDVVRRGTGTSARIEGREIGGKTGTGNDYRDAWFVGFTPGMAAGVWVGNDDFTVTKRLTGGSLPAEIWRRYMEVALVNVPAGSLEMPREEDYDAGLPAPAPVRGPIAAAGAPLGAGARSAPAPDDDADRSLDFGPEG